jgi:hypothetical protein
MNAKAAANVRTWRIPEVRAARCRGIAAALTGRELTWEHRISIAAAMKALWQRRREARA